MSTVSLPATKHLDAALDEIERRRELVTRNPVGAEPAFEVARLYELEARLWSVLFERARARLYWRAALAAEAHARLQAQQWRHRARALGGRQA